MRVKIANLTEDEAREHTRIYLEAEVARTGVLSPKETYEALRAELMFFRRILKSYELETEEGWQLDPVAEALVEDPAD